MGRYYLGVDWGDEQPGVCVREETGGIVWEGRWPTRRRG